MVPEEVVRIVQGVEDALDVHGRGSERQVKFVELLEKVNWHGESRRRCRSGGSTRKNRPRSILRAGGIAVDVPGIGPAEDLHEDCGVDHLGTMSEGRENK